MDDSNLSDVVHLGFAKVFDSVNHRFLLAKLESFGLCEKIVRWKRSYLTEDLTGCKRTMSYHKRQGSEHGGTSWISNWVISFLPVCYRRSDCHQCAFRRRLQNGATVRAKRPLAELPLNVWKWSINWDLSINPTKYNNIAIGMATPPPILLCHWNAGLFHTSRKRCLIPGCSNG